VSSRLPPYFADDPQPESGHYNGGQGLTFSNALRLTQNAISKSFRPQQLDQRRSDHVIDHRFITPQSKPEGEIEIARLGIGIRFQTSWQLVSRGKPAEKDFVFKFQGTIINQSGCSEIRRAGSHP
jgi:hypothetical protein